MLQDTLNNTNIAEEHVLVTPDEFKVRFPLAASSEAFIRSSRQIVENILDGKDHRLLVVSGPCSIHDIAAAKEYALRLKALSEQVGDSLYLVMRIYFEKPRTTVGWKGLINDPDMDDSFNIEKGLGLARELLLWLAEQNIPAATEALDPISPQYLSDLFAWAAIGARTTESQTHREMASGLSMPVGFKNGTDGNLDVAINAMLSVSHPHSFLGINQTGQVTVIKTRGNRYGHLILRGGKHPNYDSVNIAQCEQALAKAKLPQNIVVDCSHGNSSKQHALQVLVAENVASQIIEGNRSIMGIMLESHLFPGNQAIPTDLTQLKYGVSVTDACIDWDTTSQLLKHLNGRLKAALRERRL
ncbi:3-deoxy-7-phosphoheptulonate synthase [Thiothrix eikelboomii]|uniref:Phospho-2-dehydro-3-deoxyheptonate aldolase n=1 Tax=Thiothrix eikelboomii TaxID=92487 RepID=A0A1T4X997_9GAMM|nr:3-deoxy-7-phosphoheptulonate synthase [Thiothrix eikelboomii]SKA86172.1 3-deoxy-D-arabinoheptulosonate-7-phosphate synthase [Thiothrix eikelboomii]